jgi:hypothetical protein
LINGRVSLWQLLIVDSRLSISTQHTQYIYFPLSLLSGHVLMVQFPVSNPPGTCWDVKTGQIYGHRLPKPLTGACLPENTPFSLMLWIRGVGQSLSISFGRQAVFLPSGTPVSPPSLEAQWFEIIGALVQLRCISRARWTIQTSWIQEQCPGTVNLLGLV